LLIAARAGEFPVIKDSEAVQYADKNVEVSGFVVSEQALPPTWFVCIVRIWAIIGIY
jgi:hypothetical protein